MTARRSRRERKENSRYPGSIQYSQEEVEMEAEEPPDGDQGQGLPGEEVEHSPASPTLSLQSVSILTEAEGPVLQYSEAPATTATDP